MPTRAGALALALALDPGPDLSLPRPQLVPVLAIRWHHGSTVTRTAASGRAAFASRRPRGRVPSLRGGEPGAATRARGKSRWGRGTLLLRGAVGLSHLSWGLLVTPLRRMCSALSGEPTEALTRGSGKQMPGCTAASHLHWACRVPHFFLFIPQPAPTHSPFPIQAGEPFVFPTKVSVETRRTPLPQKPLFSQVLPPFPPKATLTHKTFHYNLSKLIRKKKKCLSGTFVSAN